MRRHRSFSAALVLTLLVALPAMAGTFKPAPIHGVPDMYIVVLAEGVSAKPGAAQGPLPSVAQVAQSLAAAHGGQVEEVWEHALQGFEIRMPEARARRMAEDPRVLSVEQNASISAPVGDCYFGTTWADSRTLPSSTTSPQTLNCTDPDPLHDTSTGPPACQDNWGIDRIDQSSFLRNNLYSFVNNGTTAHAYIMDTGVRWSHRELQDANGVTRVSGGADVRTNPAVAGNSVNTNDCYGHGTHVAGILGGRTFGVAKNVAIHPVRTIGCRNDAQTNQQFIDASVRGLNWIVSDVGQHRQGGAAWPSVVSWSGGNDTVFTSSQALITAVQGVVNAAIVLVEAAGNQSPDYDQNNPAVLRDACTWSFGGSVPGIIVAGGVDYYEGRWTRRPALDPDDALYCGGDCGSNGGSCIDVWAPAAHVLSSNMDADNTTCHLSGTSMAAPHVSGVVALYLQSNPTATPAQVKAALRSRGTWGALQSSPSSPNYIGQDSDNVLVYSDTRSTGDTAPVAAFSVICPGRQCNFNAGASSDDVQITSYTWRFGDGGFAIGSSPKHTFPANFSGVAVLTVTDNTGKTDHLLKNVAVNADAPPTASFTYTCTGFACTFDSNPSSDDQSIASRSWSFGDSSSGSGTTATHTYASSNSFTVELTVTDNAGQTDIASQTVTPVLPPQNVQALASGATVTIIWQASANAGGYNVERKVSSGPWLPAQSVTGGTQTSVQDTPPSSSNGVVLYRVFARSGSAVSLTSNNDVAFVGTFLDDPIATPPSYTTIRAEHITQMRAAVNGLRDIGGAQPIYTAADLDPNQLRNQAIDDAHFTTLMADLNTARGLPLVALPSVGFRVTPAANGAIARTQIEDLRLGVK
jgi:subtilisin family serine protease